MSKPRDGLHRWALFLFLLGAAFGLYGRLVRVETRLAAIEERVGEIHVKLFGARVAEHK